MIVSYVKLFVIPFTMVLSVSSASILTKLVSAPPSIIAFWRITIASLIIVSYYLSLDRGLWSELRMVFKSVAIASLISGLFLALHFYTWIWSLELTKIYVSTTLVCLHPLITTVFSALFLREFVKPLTVVGIVIAITGSSIVASSVANSSYETNLDGVILALVAAFLASAYVTLGRYVRLRTSRLGTYVLPTYTSAALTLYMLSVIEGNSLMCIQGYDILWLVLLALGPMLGGHTLLNYLLRYVKASVASVPIILEPVGASILASIVFSESIPMIGCVGVVLAVTGLIIITLRKP